MTPFFSLSAAVSPAQEREVVFLPPALEEESLPGDLFSVLFKCEAHDTPWRALLAHAVALQQPLLAILAACYEVCVSVLTMPFKRGAEPTCFVNVPLYWVKPPPLYPPPPFWYISVIIDHQSY